ncbi:MAG: hypothetical protein AB2L12_03225 [Smithellaceae bacterium]
MEYLLVNFPDEREVLIDANIQGRTNEAIEVEKGTHIIALKSPPQNFKPKQKKITLADTSSIAPQEVTFVKI